MEPLNLPKISNMGRQKVLQLEGNKNREILLYIIAYII